MKNNSQHPLKGPTCFGLFICYFFRSHTTESNEIVIGEGEDEVEEGRSAQ